MALLVRLGLAAHLAGGDDGALCLPGVAAQLPHLHRALHTELQAAARDSCKLPPGTAASCRQGQLQADARNGRHLLGQHVLGGGAALGRLQGDVGGGVGVALALGEAVTAVLQASPAS